MRLSTPEANDIMQHLREKDAIMSALNRSLLHGDIIPSLVSSVIWQTHHEIARVWIEQVAPDSFRQFAHTNGDEEHDTITATKVRWLISDVGMVVSDILSESPTLLQRFGSRFGLLSAEPPTLAVHDQDRIIASYLQIPYYAWIGLRKAMTIHSELYEFVQLPNTCMSMVGKKLIISHPQEEGKSHSIIVPSIPGGNIQTKEVAPGIRQISKCQFEIVLTGSTDRGIEFDGNILAHFGDLITTPTQDQDKDKEMRKMIFEQCQTPVWKKRFGGNRGGGDHPLMPTGRFAWQQ